MNLDTVRVLPQYLIPRLALTRFAGRVANARAGGLTTAIIRAFIARYGVDMEEALESDPQAYASFNEFFTRALRPGVRPFASSRWVCPVDGAISQCGPIEGDRIIQAKGHDYPVGALVGGDDALADLFAGGQFATLYLSPRDYHRIHMPLAARLICMLYVPGDLFSVNPGTARGVPGLFARNERLVCRFESASGPFALVLVGAMIVGSISTVWHGAVNADRPAQIRRWRYGETTAPVSLERGDEMGRFLLGSTVIVLAPPGLLRLPANWQPGRRVRMGEAMSVD